MALKKTALAYFLSKPRVDRINQRKQLIWFNEITQYKSPENLFYLLSLNSPPKSSIKT